MALERFSGGNLAVTEREPIPMTVSTSEEAHVDYTPPKNSPAFENHSFMHEVMPLEEELIYERIAGYDRRHFLKTVYQNGKLPWE